MIGEMRTVRVTLMSGRFASGPKKAELSKPAMLSTVSMARNGTALSDGFGRATAVVVSLCVASMTTTMRINEHASTTRIARVANRTPRTAIHATARAIATVVITVAAGPRTSGPTMAMVSSRLGTACEKTETEIPRYPSTSAAPAVSVARIPEPWKTKLYNDPAAASLRVN